MGSVARAARREHDTNPDPKRALTLPYGNIFGDRSVAGPWEGDDGLRFALLKQRMDEMDPMDRMDGAQAC
jgi:hypothetical protein